MNLQLVVKDIIQETPETKTIILSNVTGEEIPYEAGQFLTLLINKDGQEVRRSYSLTG